MKNIFLLPTDQPSRLVKNNEGKLKLTIQTLPFDNIIGCYPQSIYITSDEVIKVGDHVLDIVTGEVMISKGKMLNNHYVKKIILTTDPTLIRDGVQEIDNEFLEWFIKNPSCDFVGVVKEGYKKNSMIDEATSYKYKIIIPEEEPKSDLEKEMFRLEQELDIPSSIRWHNSKPEQKMQYSEDDMIEYSDYCLMCSAEKTLKIPLSPKEWFNQFHKKK